MKSDTIDRRIDDMEHELSTLPQSKVEESKNGLEKISIPPRVSLEDAKSYLNKNCDGLLRRLAQ